MQTFIIAALTADGFIARDVGQVSTDWTSKEDKKFFSERTKQAGVVVFGYNTYKTVGKPLRDRLNIVYSTQGEGIEGVEITQKEPGELLKDLEARGYREVAICGGATIYTMFMSAGVIDRLYLTIEPVLFGSGIRLFKSEIDVKLKLISSESKEGTLFLEYDIVK